MYLSAFVLSALLLCALRPGAAEELHQQPPGRIAIVGGGIGGSSAAYFLRQKFGKDVQIDVFEKGQVGGRMATIDMDGAEYEAGGSVLHPLNLHMKSFAKELGLSVRPCRNSLAGIYNGNEIIFQQSDWLFINIIKLLWYYGLNYMRMYMWGEDLLAKFARIYQYQSYDYSFSSAEQLFHALGGEDLSIKLNMTLDDSLQKAGCSKKYIDEIVTPAIRHDFSQLPRINAFVGALTLTATYTKLWSIEGGNMLVCPGLLEASEAQLIKGTVTSVQENTGGIEKLYKLGYETSTGPHLGIYNIVIIAAPINKEISNINFVGFSPPIDTSSNSYIQTVTTFVHGQINSSFFGFIEPCQLGLTDILTTKNPKLFFDSIGLGDPVKGPPGTLQPTGQKVWKITSPDPLTKDQLNLLFTSYHAVSAKKWLAFPQYNPPGKLPPIILHDQIYYINSIELAASGIELSALSAKNVALLSYHRWFGINGQIDQEDLVERFKSEL
ncbi:prenylcysteine oxidase 1-like [Pelobates fuscus]|uniref:prenylcysteine oxidase 1-like n=1 Tax=Pelobates fuscus TaxID=191477 RepID=UPI002FE44D6D